MGTAPEGDMRTWEGEKGGVQSRESKGCRHGRAPAWAGGKGGRR